MRPHPPRRFFRAITEFIFASAVASLLTTRAEQAGTTWDGGGAGNSSINLSFNWDGNVRNALDGTTAAAFGTGGSTAVINVNASFTGIRIDQSGRGF